MRKTALILTLVALGTAAFAHSGVKNKDVMARMMVMSSIADQMKVIGSMAKGEITFDAATANEALIEIAAQSAQIAPMFEIPAQDPKSEALPVIWEDWDGFTTRAAETEKVVEKLAGTIQTKADLGPAIGKIGASCKACHATYRK